MVTDVWIIAPTPAAHRLVQQALPETEWRITASLTPATLHKHAPTGHAPLVFYAALPVSEPREQAAAWEHLQRTLPPATPIIVLGQTGDAPHAPMTAMLQGAADYLPWPVSTAQIRARACAWRSQQGAAQTATGSFLTLTPYPARSLAPDAVPLIGTSPAMVAFYQQLAQALRVTSAHAARSGSGAGASTRHKARPGPTFFVTGATGTGKELVARLIHRHSRFASGPFVALNASTLPAELAEAELFGCEAGAFTGAMRRRGLWELAAGGTLFLDEITEAPLGVLPKLLRVLEDGQVRRVGGTSWHTVDLQIVAASNRTLPEALAQGTLRADLYQRLCQQQLCLPPLRTRGDDIMLLTQHFIRSVIKHEVELESAAGEVLAGYAWPGNVRELKQVVENVAWQSQTRRIYAAAFREQLAQRGASRARTETEVNAPRSKVSTPWATVQQQAQATQRRAAQEMLAHCGGNLTRAARMLGVSRPTFYKLLRREPAP